MTYSTQYDTPCLELPQGQSLDPDVVIEECREMGAIFYEDGPDDECFVVDVGRGVGPELWTECALRRTIRARS